LIFAANAPAQAACRRHPRAIALLVTLVVSVGLTLVATAAPASATTGPEQDYLNRINQLRTSLGLNPLILDPNLEVVARNHTSTMIATNSFTHSPDLAAGVTTPWLKLGENIGQGTSSDFIWPLFLSSPGHYANLTDPAFTHFGVGVVFDSTGKQWTTHRFLQIKPPPPDPDAPFGSVDGLAWSGPGTLTVTGWTIDPNTPSATQVAVYVDGVGISWFNAGAARPDIGTAYPAFGPNHGFSIPLTVSGGTHTVCVFGINVGAGLSNPKLGCRTASLSTGNPFGAADVAWSSGPGQLRVAGWTIDPDTTASTQIAVYVDGVGVSWFPAASARPDIGAAYPFGANHGFDVGFAASGGAHTVCVYAINVAGGTGNPLLGCRGATVATGVPFGSFDAAWSAAPGTLRVAGWTVDPDTATPTQIAVYVDGVGVSWFPATGSRPDIAAAFPGYGPNHGFDASFAASGGAHTVCVYSINIGAGAGNPLLGCRTATVATGNPYGAFDTVSRPTGTSLRVTGWVIDPDTAAATKVAVYVDGIGVSWFNAAGNRPDIASAFPGYGPNHGFDVTFASTAGPHSVCVYGINVGAGSANPLLGCRSI
jgi:uncharacterized protein YkwD